MLDFSQRWSGNNNIHFIHNWRCAGTSLNSLFSSNFHSSYLKIGHPFTDFGWPQSYKKHRKPLLSINQFRQAQLSNTPGKVILGGHSFNGLQDFLPGAWDIWMNFRDPLVRLNSGILRFYSRQLAAASPNPSNHLINHKLISGQINLDSPSSINALLSTTLLRESNGIARRLSAFSVCESFSLSCNDNVETIPLICDQKYSDRELFDASLSNLDMVDHLFNSSHIFASVPL